MRITAGRIRQDGPAGGELAPQYSCEVAGVVDPMSKAQTAAVDDPQWKGTG
jgi:hypothetical protein